MQEDGIHIQRHKTAGTTGKRTINEWTPELRAAMELAKSVRPALSPFLFANRKGQPYIEETTGEAHGWDSMWQRFMDRVLAETKVKARFTEHDLRAKCASDAESLEHARALLSHADARTTQAIYRRKPERVRAPRDQVERPHPRAQSCPRRLPTRSPFPHDTQYCVSDCNSTGTCE